MSLIDLDSKKVVSINYVKYVISKETTCILKCPIAVETIEITKINAKTTD
jgi:hypothetical protein